MSINISEEERAAIRKQHEEAAKKFYEKISVQKEGLKAPKKEEPKKEEPKKEEPKKEDPKK